ncbi:MAG: ABC transporter substrate-binding protein, partial [Dehalococcoidales bacterium]|nr:ABC transporter substrate-binding protein [Dehalococcoidales bacterium]
AQIGDSAFRPIYETLIPEWNADGGIYVAEYGKKLPIELKIYDDKSDTGTMVKNLEKLILDDKVDFIFPPVGTAMIFAAAPIANKYNKLLLTAEGGATQLKDALPGMPYVFINLSFSDWYEVPVLGQLLQSKGAKTAYVIYIEDLHGIEYSGVAGRELPKYGIEILKAKSVPPDIKDLSTILKDAQASGADAFLAFAYPDQVMLATKRWNSVIILKPSWEVQGSILVFTTPHLKMLLTACSVGQLPRPSNRQNSKLCLISFTPASQKNSRITGVIPATMPRWKFSNRL